VSAPRHGLSRRIAIDYSFVTRVRRDGVCHVPTQQKHVATYIPRVAYPPISSMLSKKAIQGLREVAESSARAQSDEELEADAETVDRVSRLVRPEAARTAFAVLADVYRAEIARRTATRPRRKRASG
jgi:hypothetical protein